MKIKKVNILGINIHNININEAVSIINNKIKNKNKTQIITINPEMIMEAQKNKNFLKIINKSRIVVADGYGVIWASKKINEPLKEKIAGIDLMHKLLFLSEDNNYTVYFYGAKENIINIAVKNIKKQFPKLKILGFNHGYNTGIEYQKILKNIKKLKPNIIFIGIGSPKQEIIGFDILKNNNSIVMGVGGSFDIYSNKIKRAPFLIRKINLEWLYRSFIDVKRFKRLLIIPKYIKKIYKEKK